MTHKLLNYSSLLKPNLNVSQCTLAIQYRLLGCPTQILSFPNYCVALGGRKA